MTDVVVTGVVGTDGVSPVYMPEGRWCIWGHHELWFGIGPGSNRYVPKVNDYVIEYGTYTTYIVDHIDPVTLIPTLREIRPANMSYSISETDVLFGVGPGTQSDTYRAYIDNSVIPHVLAVDIRLKVGGSMASYAKIFQGSDISATGKVISKVYDNSGNFISDSVPLELAAIDSHVNYSIKVVSVCNTSEDFVDGEILTVVLYSANGHVVSKRQLLAENTSFIRAINTSTKYITHISMDCSWMSPTFDNVIEYPLNIPINALNLMGTVHYSDGSTFTAPVDGTKFTCFGIDQYVSSIIGQEVPLVLSYTLSPGELAYAGVGVESKRITEPYTLKTTNPNNSYTVKLFGYPYWINEATGYQMRWWLLNLDRNICFDVTPYVSFSETTGAFDPKAYGYMQRKQVSVNLRDVSGAFKPHVHTQIVEIVLNGPPSIGHTPWLMSHESVNTRPNYGAGVYAAKVSSYVVNLASGETDLDKWKTKLYGNTYPLVNSSTELKPIAPTHFVVTYAGVNTEYPISEWNTNLTLSNTVEYYKTIGIKFIKRTSSGDLQLSVAAMVIQA